jgi:formylglycine-generating enzyme required for sulfatase activity
MTVSAIPTAANQTPSRVDPDPVAMVLVPTGWFLMGSADPSDRTDERPQRKVYLNAFMIDTVEVTNYRYATFIKATGHEPPANPYGDGSLADTHGIESLPVVQVTWHDAVDYCRWAGKRLPTEAEWEKAARGTDGRRFPWGAAQPSPQRAVFGQEWKSEHTMRPVGTMPEGRSPYGVMDMGGNVREWVADWYHPDYYATAPERNPEGPDDGILKVIRGGSWHNQANELRVTARQNGGFALKTDGVGFRCARAVGAPQ